MAKIDIKDLIKAGLHFGHAAASWNPKMAPYIRGKNKKVHIIDLNETVKSLVAATHLVNQCAAQGRKCMFVCTKTHILELVREAAVATESFYVCERWLGGMLTNHEVVIRRLDRLNELEEVIKQDTESGYSKKILASFKRELKKLMRDLGGVRGMQSRPDLIIVIDPTTEHIAVSEANKCGIPIIALADTNANPDNINLLIPGNDDAKRSIACVLNILKDAILEGREIYRNARAAEAAAEQEPAEVVDGMTTTTADETVEV